MTDTTLVSPQLAHGVRCFVNTCHGAGGGGTGPPRGGETPICASPRRPAAARAHMMAHGRAGTPETLAHCDVFLCGVLA